MAERLQAFDPRKRFRDHCRDMYVGAYFTQTARNAGQRAAGAHARDEDVGCCAHAGVQLRQNLWRGVLVVGTLLAFTLGRWPAASFSVGVLAAVLGTPALYLSGLVTLLALLAPMAWPHPTRRKMVNSPVARIGAIGIPAHFAFAKVLDVRRR